MNKFFKSVLAVSISSALLVTSASAAKYKVAKVYDDSEHTRYTYGRAVSNDNKRGMLGAEHFNFPVQFDYLTDYGIDDERVDDFDIIVANSRTYYPSYANDGITFISDNDEIALRAGNPNANSLFWTVEYLKGQSSRSYQSVGSVSILLDLDDGNGTQPLRVFDKKFDGSVPVNDTEVVTQSTHDFIYGMNDNGWLFGQGSAPYIRSAEEFIPEVPPSAIAAYNEKVAEALEENKELTAVEPVAGAPYFYFIREFTDFTDGFATRGFFSPDGGETIVGVLPPSETSDNPDDNYGGGESAILGMDSNNLYAVGYGSIKLTDSALQTIKGVEDKPETDKDETVPGCADDDVTALMPEERCIALATEGNYFTKAVKWTLDGNNQPLVEQLGTLVDLVPPHENDTRAYSSTALAINSSGIAVGYSYGWADENETVPASNERRNIYATIFKDGQVLSVEPDRSTHFNSKITDINDDGIAIGYTTTLVNGSSRTKAFVVDANEANPEMVVLSSNFTGAATTARAINNSGYFVGEGEVETHNDSSGSSRRREAFIHDVNAPITQKPVNLNSLLSCDNQDPSKDEYMVIKEAHDINDDNFIVATALIKEPRLDSLGEQAEDAEGNPIMVDHLRAVLLEPIVEGEIDSCPELNKEESVERQGGSLGLLTFLALFGFGAVRRRLK